MSLLILPAELVVKIVQHLAPDKGTLCALARTCRLLQIECEKHIYATVSLYSQSDLNHIINAFEHRPARMGCVETLDIIYDIRSASETTLTERMRLYSCLQTMKALKHWHIESPFDNFQWDCDGGREWVEGDMEEFRRALVRSCLPKTSLRQDIVVIHSHGAATDFWDLGGFHCLFRHPTLRDLHVSCLVLPQDIPKLESCTGSTPLTRLVFDECILNPEALTRILRTPKGLKHLTLGENVYNARIPPPPVSQNLTLKPLATLEALSHVSHSLESLTHYDPLWCRPGISMYQSISRPLQGDGLRNFHRLKFLEIDPCSFLHQFIYAHVQAPPNLETLRLHHGVKNPEWVHNENLMDFFNELPPLEPYTYIKSLKTLELVQGAVLNVHNSADAIYMNKQEAIRKRHAYAYKLFKHGINMKLYAEASWNISLLPPYLHGEQKSELICIYDAADIGFRRRIIDNTPTALMAGVDLLLASTDSNVNAMEQRRQPSDAVQQKADASTHSDSASPAEPPETDQLNDSDIYSIRENGIIATVAVWKRMLAMDGIDYDPLEYDPDDYDPPSDYYDPPIDDDRFEFEPENTYPYEYDPDDYDPPIDDDRYEPGLENTYYNNNPGAYYDPDD